MDLEFLLLALIPILLLFIVAAVFPRVGIPLPGLPTFGYSPPTIVCIGDNLTFGNGAHLKFINDGKGFPELAGRDNYPPKLAAHLQNKFKVLNYGFPGATAISIPQKDGTMYSTTPEYDEVTKVNANIAVIMLGTVDSSVSNWQHAGMLSSTYMQQLHNLVENILNQSSMRLVVLCHPPVLAKSDVGQGSLGKEKDSSRLRTSAVADAVQQVTIGMEQLIQIKQKLASSERGWRDKKVVSVNVHELLVVRQRRAQQEAFDSQNRTVRRAAEKEVKKKGNKQKYASAGGGLSEQMFHTTKTMASGVGLAQAGAKLLAETVGDVILAEYGRKKVQGAKASSKVD